MGGDTPENRNELIDALLKLAETIELSPPPIIGSDIFVQASPGQSAIGSRISVTAGAGGGDGIGQRISVTATPGQVGTVIGQRITLVVGGDGVRPPPSGASSQNEITEAVTQLRDAANVLTTSTGSEGWIKSILTRISGWGSSALSGAMSGATSAMVKFYVSGG